jgi:hypothetical protein
MKRYLKHLFTIAIGAMFAANINAQCINPFAFGSATFGPCGGAPLTATTCAFISEFSTFNGLVAGQQYQFTHTSASPSNYITITTLANVVLAHGPSPLVWTSTLTGSVRFHYSNDAVCTSSPGGCRTGTGVCLTCPPPAQATCNLAQPIGAGIVNGGTVTVTGNTACTGPAQAVPFCGTGLNTAAGQWFTFTTADCAGNASASNCVPFGTPNFDNKIGVFTGTCLGPTNFTGFTCVGGNDDAACPGGSGLNATFNWVAQPNTTYWIYVTGFGASQGPFDLTLTFAVDECCLAGPLMAEFIPNFIEICPYETGEGSLVITGGLPGPPNGQAVNAISAAGFPGSAPGNIAVTSGGDGSFLFNAPAGVGVGTVPFRGGGAVVRSTGADEAPNWGQGFYYVSTPNFYRFNPGVGETIISSNLPANAACNVWDQAANTMYFATAGFPGQLFTIDINTGATSLIGSFNGGGVAGFAIWLVIDETTGVMYMFDIANGNVYTVNKTNAACTLVGPAGFAANFGQDAYYWDGAIYSHAFNAGVFAKEYRRFNLTGGSTLIQGYGFAQIGAAGWLGQTFGGGYEVVWNTMVGIDCGEDGDCSNFTILHTNPGTYNYVVTVTDACGATTTAEMTIVVRDMPIAMACNNSLNISVDFDCNIQVRADMFLEGPYDGCYDLMEVFIWPFGQQGASTPDVNGQTVNFNGLFTTGSQYCSTQHSYMVRNPFTGVSCWGNFVLEDKFPPIITCEDIEINCLDEARLYLPINNAQFIGRPTVQDNCGGATLSYSDVTLGSDVCGKVILRRWGAKDQCWNIAQECIQTIFIDPIGFGDVFIPSPLVVLDCNDGTSPAEVVAKTGNVFDGFPFAFDSNDNLVPVGPDGLCNIHCVYTDQTIHACGVGCHGNVKVIRTWTCLDWCTGQVSVPFTQLIKAVDLEGPTFAVKDTTVSTSPWHCKADFFLPNPWELHDNCDIAPKWWVTGPGVVSITNVVHPVYSFRATGAPKGDHVFLYHAEDCCGNLTVIPMIVTVIDRTPPVAVAKQNIVISLVPGGPDVDGNAKLFAHHVDNGSYDACGPVKLEVRRVSTAPRCENIGNNGHNNNRTYGTINPNGNANDTDQGEFVKFCCEDVTAEVEGSPGPGYHMVWLRVWDDGDMNGVFGTAGDNFNETWAWVKVEDKLAPVVQCPHDAAITCDWPIDQSSDFGGGFQNTDQARFDKTGFPTIYSTCPGNMLVEFQDRFTAIPAGNNCGLGRIVRTFRVTKDVTAHGGSSPQSVICTQIIDIGPSTSQQQWTITPPPAAPVKGMPCTGPTSQQVKNGGPTWVAGPCDVIGENIKIDTFLFEDGVCKKWVAEYNYMNWCTGESRGPFFRDFVHEDKVKPEFDECLADTCYAVDANCSLTGLRLQKTASDEGGCTDQGWLKWQVFIDLWADGTIDYEFTSFVPPGTNRMIEVNGVPRRQIYVAPTLNGAPLRGQGNQLGILIPEDIGSKFSKHKVEWKVTDGCHNHQVCVEHFTVEDKKPPTPYCVHISTALMENGMVELWAKDFDLGSFDNCTEQKDLKFTFYNWAPSLNHLDVPHYFDANGFVALYPTTNQGVLTRYANGEIQRWIPDMNSSGKVFTCEDRAQLGNGAEVWVTVWDKALNFDWCVVILTMADNQGACGDDDGSRVEGVIASETGEYVQDIRVTLDANLPEFPRHTMTDAAGQFSFWVTNPGDYDLSASKTGDYLNGVSTLDLVLIQRHILSINRLDTPYKLIAADVNKDGLIATSDLVELRRLILGSIDKFSNNESWAIVDANSIYDAENPWGFATGMEITVDNNMVINDFVAVKIGDVNATATYNATSTPFEARSASTLNFVADAAQVNNGDVVELNVTAENFSNVFGYQFTADLRGLKFVGVRAGALRVDASNVGTPENGLMTMSWNADNAVSIEADDVLFTLVFAAERTGNLENMISLSSAFTKAEAYVGEDLAINNVALEFRTLGTVEAEYVLGQNEPNPFIDATVISYTMPDAAQAKFTVFDMTGRVLAVRNVDAAQGVNTIRFTREELNATGVLIYQMESGDFTSTKKMIIIE